jgi:hypothetical protein
MWIFLTARLRQYVLFRLALPLVAVLADRVADGVERRHGRTRTTRALRSVRAAVTGRRGRGRRGR